MIAPQFTPGPWRAARLTDPQTNHPYCTLYQIWVDVQSESGATICGLWANQGARMADANLIAAAPDLYAALEGMVRWMDWVYADPPIPLLETDLNIAQIYEDSTAALAKARGEVTP